MKKVLQEEKFDQNVSQNESWKKGNSGLSIFDINCEIDDEDLNTAEHELEF